MERKKRLRVGRRTGKDVRAGKKIRVNDDGLECFDDYWTSSGSGDDTTSNHEATTPPPFMCSSPTNQYVPRMSSFIRDMDENGLPERISFSRTPTLRRRTQERGESTTAPKLMTNRRTLLAKGRRTGADMFAGKEIEIKNGIENFDNYWTDSSAFTTKRSSKMSQSAKFSGDKRHTGNCEEVESSNSSKMHRKSIKDTSSDRSESSLNGNSTSENALTNDHHDLPERISLPRTPTLRSRTQEICKSNVPRLTTNRRTLLAKGRRTGVDMFEGKEIETNNGIEDFDNYWTDSSALTTKHSGKMSQPAKFSEDKRHTGNGEEVESSNFSKMHRKSIKYTSSHHSESSLSGNSTSKNFPSKSPRVSFGKKSILNSPETHIDCDTDMDHAPSVDASKIKNKSQAVKSSKDKKNAWNGEEVESDDSSKMHTKPNKDTSSHHSESFLSGNSTIENSPTKSPRVSFGKISIINLPETHVVCDNDMDHAPRVDKSKMKNKSQAVKSSKDKKNTWNGEEVESDDSSKMHNSKSNKDGSINHSRSRLPVNSTTENSPTKSRSVSSKKSILNSSEAHVVCDSDIDHAPTVDTSKIKKSLTVKSSKGKKNAWNSDEVESGDSSKTQKSIKDTSSHHSESFLSGNSTSESTPTKSPRADIGKKLILNSSEAHVVCDSDMDYAPSVDASNIKKKSLAVKSSKDKKTAWNDEDVESGDSSKMHSKSNKNGSIHHSEYPLRVNSTTENSPTKSPIVISKKSILNSSEADTVCDSDMDHAPTTKIKKKSRAPLKSKKNTINVDGTQPRRSSRQRFPPLESWRNQRLRVIYEKGDILGVEVEEGSKPDLSSEEMLLKYLARQREKKKLTKKDRLEDNTFNLKEVKKNMNKAEVFDPETGQEEHLYLHRPHSTLLWAVPPSQNENDVSYSIARCFSGELFSNGYIEICPGKEKGEQFSPDYNVALNVVEGNHIKMKVHKRSWYLNKLDAVIVPAGNAYSIRNKGKTKALLQFCTFKAPFFHHQFPQTDRNS